MYRYILFDLDGTLTDPKLGICTCVQHALSKMGIEEPDIDKLEPFIGPPLRDSFRDFYGMSDEDATKAIEYYRERFADVGKFENEVYPGIPELLADLKKKEKYLAIASSKPTVFVEDILKHFEIRDYFDLVVGSELDGTRATKEEVLDYTLKQMFPDSEIEYDEIVMIGDRKFDIDAAHNLGVGNIGVSYGYGSKEELEEAGADKIVNTVQGLRTTLLPVLNQAAVKRTAAQATPKTSQNQQNATAQTDDWKQKGKDNGKLTFAKTWTFIGPVLMYWIGGMAFFYILVILLGNISGSNASLYDAIQKNVSSWMISLVAISGALATLFVFLQNRRKKIEAIEKKTIGSKLKIAYCAAIILVSLGTVGLTNCIGFWNAEAVSKMVAELNSQAQAEASADTTALTEETKTYSYEDVDQYEAYDAVFGYKYSWNFIAGLLLLGILQPLCQLYIYMYVAYNNAKKYMFGRMPFIMVILMYAFVTSNGNGSTTVESILGAVTLAMAIRAYDKTGDLVYASVSYGLANVIFWIVQATPAARNIVANPAVVGILLITGIAAPIVVGKLDMKKTEI